jgi:hypothetical protein
MIADGLLPAEADEQLALWHALLVNRDWSALLVFNKRLRAQLTQADGAEICDLVDDAIERLTMIVSREWAYRRMAS